jgi:hypothetical protein
MRGKAKQDNERDQDFHYTFFHEHPPSGSSHWLDKPERKRFKGTSLRRPHLLGKC